MASAASPFAITSTKTLANGVIIPSLGLGVYQSYFAECTKAVETALAAGYRHFDSALAYKNEKLVGDALRQSGIPRSELFFTTKLPPRLRGYQATKKAIAESLSNCGLGYVDLYLIHAPYGDREGRLGQWRAIEEAIAAGQIRAGGVSNYNTHHLKELLESSPRFKPQVNQIELHPFLTRDKLVDFCFKQDIVLEAYSPLTRAQRFGDATLQKLAAQYDRSVAQILIRWSLQKGFIPLPKSVTESRIRSNADVYDFELAYTDMELLDALDENMPTGWDPTTEPL